MQDPYSVLGISPTATEDEIKKAYRTLAKKYHPDVNGGSAEAEQKMKEVNEAYTTIMKMRRDGTSGSSNAYGAYGNSGNAGYNSYGGAYRDPFGGFGFGGYGNYSGQSYGYGSASESSNPLFGAARNYINSGHYREAINTLEGISERSAEWYYLMSEANIGLNNRVAALNYARQAVSMAPDNLQYRVLLSQLEGNTGAYRTNGTPFNAQPFICANPLGLCCLTSMLINCCCSGCCGGGYRY